MVFGSFVAGSTPQGGGAVAFPVFTKALSVPSEVARTFSLCIQSVGMGSAALSILLTRRRISWRAIGLCLPGSIAGFAVALLLLSDSGRPFWPSLLPGGYVKVSFTLVLGSMALITYLGSKVPVRVVVTKMPPITRRTTIAALATSLVGGVASGLTGSGADVFLYLFLVVLLAVEPRVGIPTSVVLMATISIVGLVGLGVLGGQMDVGIVGENVETVAGQHVVVADDGGVVFGDEGARPDSSRTDLFGLWLAAVPVVAWGAPLGSAVAARMSTRVLIRLVGGLALAEIVSTVVFLDALRRDPWLATYAVVGAAAFGFLLRYVSVNRNRVLGLSGFDASMSVSRLDLDLRPDYRDALDSRNDHRSEE
jgi:uncharacterized membrane protein YfcA